MFLKSKFLVAFALLVLLAVTMGFAPSASVFAQDGSDSPAVQPPRQEQPIGLVEEPTTQDQIIDWSLAIAVGTGAVVAVFVGLGVIAYTGSFVNSAMKRFENADRALVSVGNTPLGQAIHSGINTLYSRFDEASDPYVMQGTAIFNRNLDHMLNLMRIALPIKDAALTEEDFAAASRLVIGTMHELTNGVPLPGGMTPEQLAQHMQNIERNAVG